jgi:hypothetical protein
MMKRKLRPNFLSSTNTVFKSLHNRKREQEKWLKSTWPRKVPWFLTGFFFAELLKIFSGVKCTVSRYIKTGNTADRGGILTR